MDLVGLWRWSKSVRTVFGGPVCKALEVSVDSLERIRQSIGKQ